LISEHERSALSEAYVFLRTLEHRLQMEHGLQTHTVPQEDAQRLLVAQRMGFAGSEDALHNFERSLKAQTAAVRDAYDRVFSEGTPEVPLDDASSSNDPEAFGTVRRENRAIASAARSLMSHLRSDQVNGLDSVTRLLSDAVAESINPQRARALINRVAASLEKSEGQVEFSERNLSNLLRLCGSSELFGEMVAGNPGLIGSLGVEASHLQRRDYRAQLRACIDPEKTFPAEIAALRREWSRLLVEIGAHDAAGEISLGQSNHFQTELAVASINVAYLIARREMVRRYGRMDGGPRLSVLAVGRLASGGVDYGSDLDVILVYDSLVSSPVSSLMQDEAYSRLCELMVAALSSVTRDGYLYRVDLRLRPDGKNGPLVASSESFLDYVRHRSAIWEWLAYVKLRAVAGDLELGRMIETHARHAIHEKAGATNPDELTEETRRVRERLELEKGRRRRHHEIDIKYGQGGMLDVYFAVRYLQLRDDIADEGDDRSTQATLARLEANASIDASDYEALSRGYALLRSADHYQRLIAGKVATLPSIDHPALREIATKVGFASAAEFSETLNERMRAIREAYDRITE
jgi:glutamate-ammonia-ligase adenylyltransferase